MSTTDIFALFHNRSIAKARSFLANARQQPQSSSSTALLSRSPGNHNGGGGGGGQAGAAVAAEVNRRDHLGRSVLHLVVSEVELWALDWLAILLPVGSLQVNLQDVESGWSALHR